MLRLGDILPEGQLCTVDDVRAEAEPIISFSQDWDFAISDTLITQWIKDASLRLEVLTSRDFLPRRAIEWYNGNDGTVLTVRRYPILKVHGCRIWGGRHFLVWEFPPDKIIYDYQGYTPEDYQAAELLVRSEVGALEITLGLLEWFTPLRMKPPLFIWNRRWLQGIQNIEIDYTAGYGKPDPNDQTGNNFLPAPPYDIRRATTLLTCLQVAHYAAAAGGGVISRTLGDRSENYGAMGPWTSLVQRWRMELYGDGRTLGLLDRLRKIVTY